ncbi:MAG TPA: RNA methyltransferase [Caldimonas sp.]|nr:RNA methyltransferase [Caldimonas sp.]HEX4234033.1 RNA methyltransferase [Caldimonas sp.]
MGRVTQITSRSNPLLVRLRKLSGDATAYRRLGTVVLEGAHLCEAWLARPGAQVQQAIVDEAAWQEPRLRRLAEAGDEVAIVPAALLAGLGTLESPAPIAFLVAMPASASIAAREPSLVLDRIQDPGNVGSALRSAAAFGFRQAIALVGTAALWSPKVLRAGMGAQFGLRLVEGADEAMLASLEVPLYGTSSHVARRVDETALPWPCAWVFGHEGQGIDPAIAARCTAVLAIPQPGGGESLNVAAAAAVCLYETVRQRER